MNDRFQAWQRLLGCYWIVLFGTLPGVCWGQYTTNGTLYTIQSNGPVSNRLNVVFFSEAYATNDLANHFLADVTNAMNNLFATQPYQEYQTYCNVYAIAVPSIDSHSTHPAWPETGTTFFSSSYDLSDYVITIPFSGLNKMTNLLKNLMPQAGLPVVLVNDYGAYGNGGGGGGVADVIDLGGDQRVIFPHETGHTLGKLQDEYDYAYSDLNSGITSAAANTSQVTNLAAITWNAWITNGTPIPTPANNQFAGTVGLFQGANYTTNGWYRPQADCAMRNLGSPFCAVCAEALVKAICQKTRTVDSFSPLTNSTLNLTNSQPVVFTLTQPLPLTHNLATQWYTNGVAVGGATNKTFTLLPGQFTNGSYVLKAQVHDPTALVKTDPSNYLTSTLTWNVAINVYKLNLDNWGLPKASTPFHFRVSGNAPYGFIVQGATNLLPTNVVNWYPLSTNFLTNGQFYFTNKLTNLPRQFYRTRILP